MRKRRELLGRLLGGVIAFLVAAEGVGCATRKSQRPLPAPALQQQQPVAEPRRPTRPAVAPRGTLYDRLGGESVVRAVVEDFVSRVAADPAVNFIRAGRPNEWQATPANLERLKQRLVEFVATIAGGPMQYQGKDMVTAHKGMAISNSEFDALAGHLRAALETKNVPRREREELINMFAGARGAIVEVADAPSVETPPPDAPTVDAPSVDAPKPDAPTPDGVKPDA